MKKFFCKSRSLVCSAVVTFLVLSMIGCGFVVSVDWIRDADNDQVVNLGDSIYAMSGEIQDFLHSYAGQTFRRYATSGAELTGGVLAPSLFTQYDIAKSDNANIYIIFMDGGGNDILLPALTFDPYNCKTQWYEWGKLSSTCKSFINDLYVDMVDLLNDMYADGVDHVIYLGYYYTKNGIFLCDDLEEAIDYGDAKIAQACQYAAGNNIFIDPRWVIKDSDIISDGIHPTTSGSLKIANLIWPALAPLL